MAKALRLYVGTDSRGTSIEVAERADGKWFMREYRFNGYGTGWSKWSSFEDVSFRTSCTNAYSGEVYNYTPEEIAEERQLQWGFNWLVKITEESLKIRLPNE